MHANIGKRGDDLRLRWQVRTLLEFKVTDSAGKGKVAIDATEVDEASRGANS